MKQGALASDIERTEETNFSISQARKKSAVLSIVLHSEISGLLVARQISLPLFSDGAQIIALC